MFEFIEKLDVQILEYVQKNLRNSYLTPIMKGISFLGKAGWFFVLCTIILLIYKKTRFVGLTCMISILIDVILANLLIKNIVARTRPYDKYKQIILLGKKQWDFSFPSGHTAVAFAFCVVVLILAAKKYGIPAIIFAVIMGCSRIYIAVHYPSDVIGGMIIGVISALLAVFITKKLAENNPRIKNLKDKEELKLKI